MKKFRTYLQQLSFPEKSAPIAFFIACFLAFGLLIPDLGFYMDDWPYVFYANVKGIDSLREMLTYDSRPSAAWLYMLGFKILGTRPIAWHISSLLMRWATVVVAWLLFKSLWPNRKTEAICISLLFAVYPFFMLQPFAVGSTHHWFGFFTFNLSLLFMVQAVRTNSYKAGSYTLLAMCLEALHLFTSEYFSGLELIRLPLLWILVSRAESVSSRKILKIFLNWLPYVIVLLFFAYWRVVIYENPPGVVRNEPLILQQLLTEPLKAIGYLANTSIKDTLSVIVVGWQNALDIDLLDLSSSRGMLQLTIALASFGLAYFYLKKLSQTPEEIGDDWTTTSISLAIVGLLTGGLPIWLIGRSIVKSKNLLSASRFGLPAMLGAALLLFLLMDNLVTEKKRKWLLLSFLLALAVNLHLENTRQFRYAWEKQIRFSQQLLWRAPGLQPGTAIFTDEEILGMMGQYAVSLSIITTYQPGNIDIPPYWYFPFYYTYSNIDDLLLGIPLEAKKLTMRFSGNSKQMILLSFNPEMNRCLWVLSPEDTNLHLVSEDMRRLSAGSDIALIKQNNSAETGLPESIYGTQNHNTWCYYFEKADLARQYGQWDEIVSLLEEAKSKGDSAQNGYEYIPFIEGYGHQEDWEQVRFLTKSAHRITSGLEPSLCSAMDRLSLSAPETQLRDETIKKLKDDLKCENYQ